MIKEIIKDEFLLSRKATLATKEDLNIMNDLVDTITFYKEECVGMAANMIGINKAIIIVKTEKDYLIMFNPKILKVSKNFYECEEGCLSHLGKRKTRRYKKIKVSYQDSNFKQKIKTYEDDIAQIIQHEIDHCNGILI